MSCSQAVHTRRRKSMYRSIPLSDRYGNGFQYAEPQPIPAEQMTQLLREGSLPHNGVPGEKRSRVLSLADDPLAERTAPS